MSNFTQMQNDERIYSWGHSKRYNDFSTYFRTLFSERVQKVSIDAGFTCPNRDGVKGVGGCTYCNNKTFKPSYCNLENSVSKQLEEGVVFFAKKYSSMKFLAYFQAYTNTYAPIENLVGLYEAALKHPKVIGLVIATRPDCLSSELLEYLGDLSKRCYIMVELGLESCENTTLKLINRGHTFEESVTAIESLAKYGIHNCAHMIVGLPGESRDTILKQPQLLSKLSIENLKLHQLQIQRGTVMAHQYFEHPEWFSIYENVNDYVEVVIDYLELLRPEIVVERFVSSSPANLLIAPDWGLKNFEFVAKVEKRLKERDSWQGKLFLP